MKSSKTEEELRRMRGMAKCLMLLNKAHGDLKKPTTIGTTDQYFTNDQSSSSRSRIFECKTCSRQFASFQALGGHRASHKKPRLMMGGGGGDSKLDETHIKNLGFMKSKSSNTAHECTICGQEFTIGQALGGHMRRHRNPKRSSSEQGLLLSPAANNKVTSSLPPPLIGEEPVLKKNKQSDHVQSKRFSRWDLNLSPPHSESITDEEQIDDNHYHNNQIFRHESSTFSKSILASMLTLLPPAADR